MRRNKRDRFEGKEIIEVEKLDCQKIEHRLCIMMDYFPHTEQAAQRKTKDIWSRKHSSGEEEDEDEEPVRDDKLAEILFARLAAISALCPTAGYSNRGLKSEM